MKRQSPSKDLLRSRDQQPGSSGDPGTSGAPVSRGETPSVEVRELVKRFDRGRVTALGGVDLAVHPGELLVLVGLSGSGKSTLLRTLNGLETPTSGQISVFGQDPSALGRRDLRRLRHRIGFVFQQFNLVGRVTALENVLSGALGRLKGPRYGVLTYRPQMRREALEQLGRVGLAEKSFQRTDTLSGGQQQRVAIARMLFQKPELVLADEPVASLDPESSRQVMEVLFACCAEDNLTVVCSLHQVDLALGWADRVVGMRAGKIVLDRPVDQLDDASTRAVYEAPGEEQ